MGKCPKCGKVWPDEVKFCGICGTELKGKSLVRSKKLWLYVFIIIIVGSTATGFFFRKGWEQDNAYICLSGEKLQILSDLKKKKLVDIPSELIQGKTTQLLKFSSDGKYILFLARYDDSEETGNLYRCEYRKLKRNSSKNEKYCELIDSDVMADYTFVENDNVIYRDKNADLYLYNGKNSEVIDQSVSSVYYTDDLSKIVYEKGSYWDGYTLFGVELNNIGDKIQLATEYTYLYQITDFDEIFYSIDDDEGNGRIYVTGLKKASEELGERIQNMYAIDNDTMFYSTKADENIDDIVDSIVIDSRGDTDDLEKVKKYLRMYYGIDEIKTLNLYKNGESKILSRAILKAQNMGEAILYVAIDNIEPIDIAKYEEDPLEIMLRHIAENSIYVVSKKTGQIINITGNVIYEMDELGEEYSEIYVTDDNVVLCCNENVMVADIHNGKIDNFQTLTDSGKIRSVDTSAIYYVTNEYTNNKTSYCDIYRYANGTNKCIVQNVIYSTINMYEDKSILAYTDYENGRGYELTLTDEDGKQSKIGDEISSYIRCNDSSILYLADSDLWVYMNGKNIKIASNIDLIWGLKSMKIEKILGTIDG